MTTTDRLHDVRVQAALRALAALPDEAMCLVMWHADENGRPVSPCTRQEIQAGLVYGYIDPAAVLADIGFAEWINSETAAEDAIARRQTMRLA